MGAEPERLVLMLYRGSLRFIREGITAIEEDQLDLAHVKILRAHAIVGELMATLDFDEGGEIAENLELTYEYILHLLTEADMKKDPSLLNTAAGLIEPLAEAWEEAFFEDSPEAPEPPAAGAEDGEGEAGESEDVTSGASVDLTG